MVTPLTSTSRTYLPGKDIVNDGDPIVTNTADAGGSITELVDAAIVSADGAYDGAIIFFRGDTTTVALQGHFEHVRTWLNSTKTFTFAKDLPAIPVAGDTYSIIFGGNKRSDQQAFGLEGGGVQPELAGIVGTNVTGVTLTQFSGLLGEGVLTVDFTFATSQLKIKMDSDPFGLTFTVTGDANDQYLFADGGEAYLRFDVVQASLPGSDQSDTHTLTIPVQTLTPDYEGYETLSDDNGKTRYRLEVIQNDSGSDSMLTTKVFSSVFDTDTTTIDTGTATTAKSTFDVQFGLTWPSKAFWLYNVTKDDCRYVLLKSGVQITTQKVDWMEVGFDAAAVEAFQGDVLTDLTTGATGIIDQVFLDSGSYGGGDGAGTFLIKKVVGSFNNNDTLQVSAVTVGLVDGSPALGLRGLTAQTWVATDTLQVMSEVDLGLETPTGGGSDTYQDPATETENPSGITFVRADSLSDALDIGTLVVGQQHGVWRREWIMEGAASRTGINPSTNYNYS